MSAAISSTRTTPEKIEYPESDGQPMAETDVHIREIIAAKFALDERYRDDPQVYVAANLLLYYETGNPAASVAPDVFVAFGVPKRERRTYKLWEEGQPPAVVFEFTSRATREVDLGRKRFLYEELGVREYFLFDPLGEFLRPKLQGFRREDDYYVPQVPEPLEQPHEWRLASRVLGLELRTDSTRLMFFDTQIGGFLRSPHEEAEARRHAEAEARSEAEARQAAETRAQALEAELAQLQAELARLRGESHG